MSVKISAGSLIVQNDSLYYINKVNAIWCNGLYEVNVTVLQEKSFTHNRTFDTYVSHEDSKDLADKGYIIYEVRI